MGARLIWDSTPHQQSRGGRATVDRRESVAHQRRLLSRLASPDRCPPPPPPLPDADGAKHVVEEHPDLTQICFIVAHADAVVAIAINHGNLRRLWPISELIQLASRADRAVRLS